MAVVKANADGHGLVPTALALADADAFAVARIEEATLLRAAGISTPIVLLEGVFDAAQLAEAAHQDLELVVHDPLQIALLAAARSPHRFVVWLKIDTGMNRLGFRPEQYRSAWTRLNALPQVDEISLMAHFSDADGPKGVTTQMATFNAASAELPGERTLHNSAAILRHSQLPGDWVRGGIALYGSSPDHPEHTGAHWQLQPTMSLNADIIGTQHLKAGDTVGYGSSFVAPGAMRIGIVACGYADGYPRICPTGTPVLVAGIRSRTLGRVSMDMLAVDLTPAPEAGLGDEVTLWGRASNGQVLPIDEVAACAQTVGYELMCALAQRVPVTVDP
jgi:alanine racemase